MINAYAKCVYTIFVITLLFLHIGTAVSYRVATLLVVLSLLTIPNINGHNLLITQDSIGSLSDDFVKEVSHNYINKFPTICNEHMPPKCEPVLLPFVDNIVVLIPSVDPLKQLEFTNTSIISSNELSLTDCFRYIPKDNISSDLYVLCLKNNTHEITIVTYLIEYDESFTPIWFPYSNDYGGHIDLDSPLAVISSNVTGPEVLYIATNRGNTWLYIKHLSAGGDSVTIKPLPNNCASPYEVKHLYQSYALLKCSNGFVHIYDTFIGEFTKLAGVQGVAMIHRCTNSSSSFVMITHQGNILLNKTASDPLRSIPSFKITVNSHQLKAISSFTCHWNGLSTQLYFTTSQEDDMIYYLSVSLEHIAESTVTEAHQMLKFSTTLIPSYIHQPSIEGSTWITALTDEDNNVQERVFINVKTGASSRRLSDGLSYLLSYSDRPFHTHENPTDIVKPEETESDVTGYNGLPQYIFIILIICTALIAIIIPVLLIIFCKFYRGHRSRPRLLDTSGHRPIELVQRQETYSHISGDTDSSMLADTSFNEGEIPFENQSTNEVDSYPQAAANFHLQPAINSNPQTAVDSNPPAAVNSNPQAAIDTNPQTALDFNPLTLTDSHPRTAVDFNPETDADSNPLTLTDSYPQSTAVSNPLTSTNSYPRTATDSPSHDIENTTNPQAGYGLENQSEFVPSEEASGPSQWVGARGQVVVTGVLQAGEPGVPHEPRVPPYEPRGHDSDDETSNDP